MSKPGAGINCWDASPEMYKVLVDEPTGKLVSMVMKPEQADEAHDHAPHYMYIKQGGKLKIAHDGKADEKEMPSGIGVFMPAGPHQVTNVGTNDVEVLFVEVTGKLGRLNVFTVWDGLKRVHIKVISSTGETPENHLSPFETDPDHCMACKGAARVKQAKDKQARERYTYILHSLTTQP